ncbi:very long chain fatty acid elongase 1-like [Lineus longissimus]|uniref:very long chain fatty acid elongase 1-like n=1 Tax=Lineus longissimus TaxID=88925 RepID=UPI002B4F8C8E
MAENNTITLTIFLNTVVGLPSFKTFCAYMFLVLMSPLWQAMTKPVFVRPVLVVYNFICCFVSICTFLGFVYFGFIKSPSIYDMKPAEGLGKVYYLYYFTKNLELMDTVFMVLRHKQRQISFLHVFHHSSMVMLSNFAAAYTPWPAIAFYLSMNSFVHICLYIYYGMAAMCPDDPPQWKKQVTQLQIAQFLIGSCFGVYGYLNHSFCIYSILYALIMTVLFSNFYYHSYVGRPVDLGRKKSKAE